MSVSLHTNVYRLNQLNYIHLGGRREREGGKEREGGGRERGGKEREGGGRGRGERERGRGIRSTHTINLRKHTLKYLKSFSLGITPEPIKMTHLQIIIIIIIMIITFTYLQMYIIKFLSLHKQDNVCIRRDTV